MLRPRVIPCLLVRRGGLVKTRKFKDDKYVGDPINAVRIFNEKEADELIVLDIDASAERREPDYAMIAHLAEECRMPLCYGGGVTSVDQAKRIMSLGVEKVAVSSGALARPAAGFRDRRAGRTAKCRGGARRQEDASWAGIGSSPTTGSRIQDGAPIDCAKEFERLGAGEIVLNSIDLDGAMTGYDLALARELRSAVHVPITLLGGAGSFGDLTAAAQKLGIVGLAAGSLFVFKGPYRAVLISYLSHAQRAALQATIETAAH